MVYHQDVRYCIVCGEAFLPSHTDEARCSQHGGQGRLVGDEGDPVGDPQRTKLDPAGPGEPTRLDDGREGQPTKMDEGQKTLVDGDPSLPGEKPPISLGEESEEVKDDGDPVQTEADVPVKWEAGDRILDLYEVKGVLGKGGFGVVYRVYHTAWDLDLAVKAPLQSALKKGGTQDFVSEAEDWMDLGLHPHITTCHYVRTLGGVPRVFAELVEGGSLHDWMTKGRLYEGTQEEVLKRLLDIAVQFAWGLDYAHEQGMIHQDVKPENALMTEAGSVKVTDFGLVSAKAVEREVEVQAEDQEMKKTVLVKGRGMTPAYCSPEQSMGQMLSRRTDLWSWGLSVLASLAGERFWGDVAGPLAEDSLNHYLEEGPKRAGIPAMPDGLVALLQEVFQEDPDDRPHDMDMAAQRVIEVYEEKLDEPYPREKPEAAELRADSLNNRALSLMDLGREEEAEEVWQQALAVDSHHPQTMYNYGLRRWRTGCIDDLELVKQLSEVIGAQPNAWEPRYLQALVHMERDDCQSTIEVLESISSEEYADNGEVRELIKRAKKRLPYATCFLRTLEGHEHNVTSVDLSVDGRYVLSGSEDKTLKLWDVDTGLCLRTLKGHDSYVYSVQLSADGQIALSGSWDGTLKLWDVETGECLRTFQGHESGVLSVHLSVDGRNALSGGIDKTLKLWEVETGDCLRTFQGHEDDVKSVHLSADGQYALSGSRDNTLKLWEVETGECLHTFQGHKDDVESVDFSADGRYVLSGSEDNTLKLWSVERGVCLRTFTGHKTDVTAVHLDADGRIAISGSGSQPEGGKSTVKLWDISTGVCLRTFEAHGRRITGIHLSVFDQEALSGSDDNRLKLWRVSIEGGGGTAPARLSRVVEGEGAAARIAKFKELLSQSRENIQKKCYREAAIQICEARSIPGYRRNPQATNVWAELYRYLPHGNFRGGWEIRTLTGHELGVNAVHLGSKGRYALSGSSDGTLMFWEVMSGKCLRTFEAHEGIVSSVYLSADGRAALSGSWDKTLKLWDVQNGKCRRTFKGHIGKVLSVALSADKAFAFSSSMDNTIKLWSTKTGECLRTYDSLGHIINSIQLSADNQIVLSGSGDRFGDDNNVLQFWNIKSGKSLKTLQGHKDEVTSVRLGVNQRYAFTGSEDTTIKMWDVEKGTCIHTFVGHEECVNSICLTKDGQFMLSGSGQYYGRGDNACRVWDIESGECLRTFRGHDSPVNSVHLSADGRFALSGSSDKTLKLWFLDWELESREPADWDKGARPYLENFLTLHTPYAGELPENREPTEEEIQLALTRRGIPTWEEEDFQELLVRLGRCGYGWLRPEGIREKLEEMAQEREENVLEKDLTTRYCILCGQAFTSDHPDQSRCPTHRSSS